MRIPVRKQIMWWGVAAVALLLTLWLLGQAVLPFILGAGVAYLLDPVADRLERMGLSRTMSVVVITFVVVLVFVAVVLLIVPVLLRQASALIETAPQMLDQARAFVDNRFPGTIPQGAGLEKTLADLQTAIGERAGSFASTILGSVRGVIGTIALLVIVPVVAFYLLLDWDNMIAKIDGWVPRDHVVTVRELSHRIDRTIAGFVRGQGTVCIVLGLFYGIALSVTGLNFGLLIGLFSGLISFIPYVGSTVGLVLAVGVALVQFWPDYLMIGVVAGVFFLGQFFEGNILQPRLVGSSVGLHPVWLMFALFAFGALFGFVGMLIAVPTAAVIGVLVRFGLERYLDSDLYQGNSRQLVAIDAGKDPADDGAA